MTVGFDEYGIKVDSIEEIRNKQIERAEQLFAPYLNGNPLLADDSSVLGRLLTINSETAYDVAEIVPAIVSAFRLTDATGLQLDNLGQLVFNKKRKNASQAVGDVILHGEVGTVIPSGSEVRNVRTGDLYSTDQTETLTPTNVNGIDLVVNTLTNTYEISYSVNGYLSESPNIVVQKSSIDATIDDIKNRIVDAVNTQSTYLEASLTKDNLVSVRIKDRSRSGDFSVTSSEVNAFDIENVYRITSVTSETYNSQESLEGQVTSIASPVIGWKGVTNAFKIEESMPVEQDSWYRERLKLYATSSVATSNAINFALKSVRGVSYVNMKSNKDGVFIIVQGGNVDEVALAIYNNMTAGIQMNGNIERTVKDTNGVNHIVKFSRPKLVAIQISFSLIVSPNFPKSGQIQIKQAIVDWFNQRTVGEDIYLSRLYEPINTVQGFSVRNLRFSRVGENLHTQDFINIGFDEIATISADNIYIGGS